MTSRTLNDLEKDYYDQALAGTLPGIGGGTQYVVDNVASATPTGTVALVVRKDTAAALAGTTGDYTALEVNARGAQWVAIEDGAGGQITSFGGGTQYTEDVASAADPIGTMLIARRKDTLTAAQVSADGDNIAINSTSKGEIYTHDTDAGTKLDTLHSDLIATNTQLPSALGQTTAAGSLSVVTASDATSVVAQASTTSGQKGNLVQGAVTTSAPSYTTGQTSPLSLDTSGNLRTTTALGTSSNVIGKVSIDQTTPGTTNLVQQPDGAQVTGTMSAAIPTATVTISTASPGVITWTSHGRSVNEPIVLSTGGTMAAPFVAGNTYYVASVIDANSFTLSSTPGGTAINTSSSGTGTQTATASVIFYTDMTGYGAISMAFGPSGNMNVIFEQSEDYSYWYSTMVSDASSTSTTLNMITTISGSTSTTKYWSKKAKLIRVRCTSYTSGTTTITATKLAYSPGGITAVFGGNQNVVGPTGDGGTAAFNPVQLAAQSKTANRTALATDKVSVLTTDAVGKLIVRPNSIPEAEWSYAAASGGISNTTTAVTVASAAGSGIRNYITGIQLSSDALGTATEFAIRDGASGTVLWRFKIGTAGIAGFSQNFGTPLKGTANTLLEVVTLTASGTGAVFVNLQGYTAP